MPKQINNPFEPEFTPAEIEAFKQATREHWEAIAEMDNIPMPAPRPEVEDENAEDVDWDAWIFEQAFKNK